MSRIKRTAVLSAVALGTAFVALGWDNANDVSAHGVISVENQIDGGSPGKVTLNFFEPVGQEFTATNPRIIAADVLLFRANQDGAADITLRVRAGTIDGAILGSLTQPVPQDLVGDEWIHFDLPATLNLTPGQVYVIELETTNFTHSWNYEGTGNYAGGAAILAGNADPSDFAFRIYAEPLRNGDVDCDGVVNSVDALKILRHKAGLSVSQTEPCVDIDQPIQ